MNQEKTEHFIKKDLNDNMFLDFCIKDKIDFGNGKVLLSTFKKIKD
jgi:hypothetical protein